MSAQAKDRLHRAARESEVRRRMILAQQQQQMVMQNQMMQQEHLPMQRMSNLSGGNGLTQGNGMASGSTKRPRAEKDVNKLAGVQHASFQPSESNVIAIPPVKVQKTTATAGQSRPKVPRTKRATAQVDGSITTTPSLSSSGSMGSNPQGGVIMNAVGATGVGIATPVLADVLPAGLPPLAAQSPHISSTEERKFFDQVRTTFNLFTDLIAIVIRRRIS